MNKLVFPAAVLAALLAAYASVASAQSTDSHASHHAAASATPAAELSQGEVRKIDQAAAKLTLKHGELKNLGMPGMTMTFGVAQAALLDGLKPGDAVRFRAEKRGEALVVTEIRRAAAR